MALDYFLLPPTPQRIPFIFVAASEKLLPKRGRRPLLSEMGKTVGNGGSNMCGFVVSGGDFQTSGKQN
jgi:hypothetical protein